MYVCMCVLKLTNISVLSNFVTFITFHNLIGYSSLYAHSF